MALIFLRRWRGIRLHMAKSEKPKTEIYGYAKYHELCLIIAIRRYNAGVQVRVPTIIRRFILRTKWSGPVMALSDFIDDCLFQIKHRRYS